MLKRIHRRRDVHPSEGRAKYEDATFAGPVHKKCPSDTPGWIKAAWAYIHQPRNATKYTAGEPGAPSDRGRSLAVKTERKPHLVKLKPNCADAYAGKL
jgi:hypothetical protein